MMRLGRAGWSAELGRKVDSIGRDSALPSSSASRGVLGDGVTGWQMLICVLHRSIGVALSVNCMNFSVFSRAGNVQENPCESLQTPVICVIVGTS